MLAGTILLLKYNSYHNVGFTTAALLLVSQLVLVNAVLLRAGGNKAYGRSSFRGAIGIGSIFYIFAIPEVLLMLYYRRELSKRGIHFEFQIPRSLMYLYFKNITPSNC